MSDRDIWEQLKRIADTLGEIEKKLLDVGMKPTYIYFDECPPGITELFREYKTLANLKRVLNKTPREVKDDRTRTEDDRTEGKHH